MRRLLKLMGDPHLGLHIIHVAGTKGKGSTSVMIAAALAASGVRTGLYCSPHLHRLEERFTVDGKPASPAELIDLVDVAREAVEHLEREQSPAGFRGPTFFEITTAMGLLHFARRRSGPWCSRSAWAVGSTRPTWFGRLSQSSPASRSTTCASSVTTSESIATEKAGILKRGRPGISGARRRGSRAIRRVARQHRSRCANRQRFLVRRHPSSTPDPAADHGAGGGPNLVP